jgi:hypothetical protein
MRTGQSPIGWYFETIDSEDKAYWLGFLYADGCVRRGSETNIKLHKKDINHLKKFKETIKSHHKISKWKDYVSISVYSKKMYKDLVNLGCVPNKSKKDLSLPNISNNLIKHFIRGYFDGDGNIYIYNGNVNVSFYGNKHLLKEIQNFLFENGVVDHLNKITDCNGCFRIKYSCNHGNKLLNFMYKNSTVSLDRKRSVWEVIHSHA